MSFLSSSDQSMLGPSLLYLLVGLLSQGGAADKALVVETDNTRLTFDASTFALVQVNNKVSCLETPYCRQDTNEKKKSVAYLSIKGDRRQHAAGSCFDLVDSRHYSAHAAWVSSYD